MKTAQEFNLVYGIFLKDGYDGLSFTNEKFIEILNEIFKDLVKIPDFQYSQIKVKFGEIRFYSSLSHHLGSAIESYLNKRYKELTVKNNEEGNNSHQ